MGRIIEVCRYIPEREEKIEEYSILSNLSGKKGQKYLKKWNSLNDECHEESSNFSKIIPKEFNYINKDMTMIWYDIWSFCLGHIYFNLNSLCDDHRIFPENIRNIYNDYQKMYPLFIESMKLNATQQMKFFTYCIENNLMIFPG